jgi:hypothetical protein
VKEYSKIELLDDDMKVVLQVDLKDAVKEYSKVELLVANLVVLRVAN